MLQRKNRTSWVAGLRTSNNVRAWKINLIERTNPHWIDLYPSLPGVAPVPVLVPSRTMGSRDKREDDT